MSEEEKTKEEVKEEAQEPKEAPKEEPKQESAPEPVPEPAKEEKKEKKEVPAKFKKLIEEVENMSVIELNDLVKALEEKFGVSAAAVAAAPAAGGAAGEAEEKSEFTAELASAGEAKIAVIKAVKEALALGLKEAKDLVEAAPTTLKAGLKKEEAEELKKKVEEAGGKVELK